MANPDWIEQEMERRREGQGRPLTQSEHEAINSRHPGETLEYCALCDEATGRAGRGEDSIFCDECEDGPFCTDCWADHPHNPDRTKAEPIGRCSKCGTDYYIEGGFCGGCKP